MSDVLKSIVSQYEENTKKKEYPNSMSNGERLKKYFSTTLKKGESTGEKIFRIIPTSDGSSPFKEQWCHEVQLDGKWVKIHCLRKNDNKLCPLCEVADELSKGTEQEKATAGNYRARRFYVVKGVDRDFEEDGPKFWRFRHNSKKQGVLDKIVPIFTKKGDITDPEVGRDLVLSLARDDKNFAKIASIMPEDPAPLSKDIKKMDEWLNDTTTFRDVYSVKSFDYLEIIAEGSIPYFDKEIDKFISKEAWEAKYKKDGQLPDSGFKHDDDVEDIDEVEDIGGEVVEEINTPIVETKKPETKTTKKPVVETPKVEENDDNDSVDDELDDLPF